MGRRGLVLLVCGVAAATTLVGGVLALRTIRDRPRGEATVEGLFLRLDRAEWLLDQMEHSERFPMPASMMPDLPPHGVFRLSVEVALHNSSEQRRAFRVRELFFRSSRHGMWPATGGELEEVVLAPGQALNIFSHFDVAESEVEGDLRLLWLRDGATLQMLSVPHPPDHFHDEEQEAAEPVEWPASVADLGAGGDPQRGEVLFNATYACVSCHGHPAVPDSHTVGPHLASIGRAAAGRVAGISAEQYLYESVLEPDAFIADGCKTGPCPQPSTMPPFSALLSPDEMRDLIAFLAELE